MLVTLHNFKCYQQERTFKLSNGINLLKGISGKGKSTVLNAISWCLYGGIVKDLEGKKKKSHVRLEIDNLNISRYKNPSLLVVIDIKSNTKYEGDSAQAIINGKFGSKTIFMCSGYLAQGERNSLISLSDKEKIDILNSFAFRDEDPSYTIQKIKTYLDQIESDYLSLNNQYQIKYGIYIKWTENVKLNTLSRPEFDNNKLSELIHNTKQELESINNRIQIADKKKWQQNQLDQALIKLEDELKLIGNQFGSSEDLDREIGNLRNQQLIAIQHNNIVNTYTQLKSQFDRYHDNCSDDHLNFDINKLKYQQEDFSRNHKIAKELGISYDKQSIELTITGYQLVLDGQRNAQIKEELMISQRQLSNFASTVTTLEDVEECKANLRSVTERSVYLTCPHCNNSVQHINQQLVKQSESPTTQEEVKMCRNKLTSVEQQYQVEQQRQKLELHIATLQKLIDPEMKDVPLLKTHEVEHLRKQISKLQSIRIIDPVTVDIDVVERSQKRHQLKLQLDKIKESSKYDVTTRLDDPQNKIKQLEQCRKILIEQTTRRSMIEASITDTKLKLKNLGLIEDIDKDISKKLSDQIIKYQIDTTTNNVILENTKYQTEINDIVNQSNLKRKDHESGKKLLETAKQLERITLQHVIDTINIDITDILGVIFNDPITVSLELFRETKDHQIKPTVNIKINYRGIEYSKVSELSGGEIDRISLALTIALNRISHCPIMLLDEVLSSLDMNAKESCLGVIKQYSGKKIVNCIDHEGVDGLYTDVISFE